MTTTRMTHSMRSSLQLRLQDLDDRIAVLVAQSEGDDSVEATALTMQLTRERSHIADALRDARLIDDEPFDVHAIEIGDLVTIRDRGGEIDRYVLVDEGIGSRARRDWVSVHSPLGAALLGRSTGDLVEVGSPSGPISYTILGFERASQEALAARADDRAFASRDRSLGASVD